MDSELLITFGDTSAGISLDGACLTRFSVGDEDLLFPDGMLEVEGRLKRRGGMPLLFPNAGPLLDGSPFPLPQHGFARDLPWELLRRSEDAATISLKRDADERYPFSLRLEVSICVAPGRLDYGFSVVNESPSPLPMAPGLHPYFAVPYEFRSELITNAPGFDPSTYDWSEVLVLDRVDPLELTLPGGTRLTAVSSSDLTTTVIWSEPGRDFLCIEPWAAAPGALTNPDACLHALPGETKSFHYSLAVS